MTYRPAWARSWDERKYCGEQCRRTPLDAHDRALETTIANLLAQRAHGATICPSEAARAVFGEDAWRPEMERARRAARRLVDGGAIEITQQGHVVNGDTAKGPIRLRARRPTP
jgi:hypothetical protein